MWGVSKRWSQPPTLRIKIKWGWYCHPYPMPLAHHPLSGVHRIYLGRRGGGGCLIRWSERPWQHPLPCKFSVHRGCSNSLKPPPCVRHCTHHSDLIHSEREDRIGLILELHIMNLKNMMYINIFIYHNYYTAK